MIAGCIHKLRLPLLGASAAALALATTTALAGSGVGGVFNLGQVNTVDAQTTLSGNPGGNPLLRAINSGTGAAVRGEAQNGIGVNGIAVTGTGQQGQSQNGIGLLGIHSATTGVNPGVQGQTVSADPNGAGVVGKNTGGGPGLKAVVNAGAPPLAVNSTVKVANLNADLIDGLDSASLPYWKLGGNAGTTPGTDFLGTADSQALELKVNGQRALRLQPVFGVSPDTPSVIGGSSANTAPTNLPGATIGGGGAPVAPNAVALQWGTVSGGVGNTAGGIGATVAGGASNTASGDEATVVGGNYNTASGGLAIVAGGAGNTAGGVVSFAAGHRAKALNRGTFVWADGTNADFASTADDQFLVRTSGGARFVRGASLFSPTGAALQSENATGSGEAAWLRIGDASSPHAVVSLVKQSSGPGNFLTCWSESSGSFSGKCHIDAAGTFVAGSDFAESLPARGGRAGYEPGDVLVASVSRPGEVERSHKRFDRALLGVYSTRPAVLGADKGGVTRVGKNDVPVAITGIVPVKVTAENGPVRPGDLLTSSSLPGRAMNAGRNPAVGTVLGKSLGVLTRGRGVVRALVMLR
jgi:hypothetical protein